MPSCYSAVAFCSGRSTMSGATPEAQKRRSGHIDRVRPTPVGSIIAHEAIVIGTPRAFLRGANRRPTVQEATALSFTVRAERRHEPLRTYGAKSSTRTEAVVGRDVVVDKSPKSVGKLVVGAAKCGEVLAVDVHG